MLALPELQNAFRRVLVEDDAGMRGALGALIEDGPLPASERLAIYRNNVLASLTDVLKETFPVVCRLVDERFFSYAAHEFIARHPPSKPSLAEYGAAFPGFLEGFPPTQQHVYLADVARFEWLMNAAAHASDTDALSPEAMAAFAPEEARRLTFRLHPSYGYLASPFPVDAIWRANRTCVDDNAAIDLDAGGVHIEVSRQGGDVVFRKAVAAEFAFRNTLARGETLGVALTAAFAASPEFLAADALGALFAEGAVAAVTLSTEQP